MRLRCVHRSSSSALGVRRLDRNAARVGCAVFGLTQGTLTIVHTRLLKKVSRIPEIRVAYLCLVQIIFKECPELTSCCLMSKSPGTLSAARASLSLIAKMLKDARLRGQ